MRAAFWCTLNGLQLQILSSPLQPLSPAGQLSRSRGLPLSIQSVTTPPPGQYLLYSLLFMLLPCLSASRFSIRMTPCRIEAVAASCVSQVYNGMRRQARSQPPSLGGSISPAHCPTHPRCPAIDNIPNATVQ